MPSWPNSKMLPTVPQLRPRLQQLPDGPRAPVIMLRTRLSLGLVCLCLILLAMGLYSINQCGELGHRIETITRENDQSGRGIQRMKRSGAAMTGALLSVVTVDHAESGNDFAAASKGFEEAL